MSIQRADQSIITSAIIVAATVRRQRRRFSRVPALALALAPLSVAPPVQPVARALVSAAARSRSPRLPSQHCHRRTSASASRRLWPGSFIATPPPLVRVSPTSLASSPLSSPSDDVSPPTTTSLSVAAIPPLDIAGVSPSGGVSSSSSSDVCLSITFVSVCRHACEKVNPGGETPCTRHERPPGAVDCVRRVGVLLGYPAVSRWKVIMGPRAKANSGG